MRKNVQLSYDLFHALLLYHLAMDDTQAKKTQQGLEQKLDTLVMHELFSKSKTAPTKEEREKARREYLDRRGIPDNFRW